MDTKSIIDKFIEREERRITDANDRRDVDDHKWHRAKKQAFEEVKPFFQQLLDENDRLQKENDSWSDGADELTEQINWRNKRIDQLQTANERFEMLYKDCDGVSKQMYRQIKELDKGNQQLQSDKAIAVTSLKDLKYQIMQADHPASLGMLTSVNQALEQIEGGKKE